MGPQPAARWAVLGLLFGAPVSAEYLQAYLTSTGDALELLVGLILAPLYGGAALVIREVAVRTGRGWPGILLLAGAFGVIMPGLVDLSLFTEHETDVTGWDELWSPTSVPLLGISVHSGIAWALGHVVMSIGVPIALLEALAPKLRGRSLLGREGLVVVVILWLASAALVHSDSRGPGSTPHPAQVAGVLAVAIGLVLLARTRFGRPVRRRVERRAWGTIPTVGLGLATMLAVDLPPPTWIGLVLLVVVVLGIGVVVALAARSAAWGLPQVTGLASGALVERALVGFVAPLAPGVEMIAKLAQSAVLLALVVVVVILAIRAARPARVEVTRRDLRSGSTLPAGWVVPILVIGLGSRPLAPDPGMVECRRRRVIA